MMVSSLSNTSPFSADSLHLWSSSTRCSSRLEASERLLPLVLVFPGEASRAESVFCDSMQGEEDLVYTTVLYMYTMYNVFELPWHRQYAYYM